MRSRSCEGRGCLFRRESRATRPSVTSRPTSEQPERAAAAKASTGIGVRVRLRSARETAGRAEDHQREPAPIHQDDRRLPYGWRLVAGVVALALVTVALSCAGGGEDEKDGQEERR